jgi:flagellar biosynthesis protein FlhB
MADNKTEQPTPKRLKEARKRGQVSKSNDLTQASLFITASAALSLLGGRLVDEFRALLIQCFDPKQIAGISEDALLKQAGSFLKLSFLLTPFLAALLAVSASVTCLQVGGIIFYGQALTPKPERLDPVRGFQRIFLQSKTYLELGETLIKFSAIIWLSYSTFRGSLNSVVLVARVGLPQATSLASQLLLAFLFKTGAVFLVIGAADFLLQRRLYLKELRMTKEEVKKEYKEDEGDPHIKHQRKHLHQQLVTQGMLGNLPRAKAVVVNPTHLAIALEYEETIMAAPQIAAKGQMRIARQIVEIARQNRIPIVRNVPLAHSLFTLEIGEEIPEELYQAVAEIFNWVQELARTDIL